MGAKFKAAGGFAGIGFVVLLVISLIFGVNEDPPGFDASAETYASYVSDNRGELQTVMALTLAAAPFFLLFLAGVVRTLRLSEERGPAMLAAVAFAGGILLVGLAQVGAGLQWAASYQGGALDPGVVRTLWEAGQIVYVATLGVGLAALAGAVGVVALATGAMSRLLGAASVGVAIYVFVVMVITSFSETGAFSPSDGVLGQIGFIVFLAWVLAVSLALLSEKGQEETAA